MKVSLSEYRFDSRPRLKRGRTGREWEFDIPGGHVVTLYPATSKKWSTNDHLYPSRKMALNIFVFNWNANLKGLEMEFNDLDPEDQRERGAWMIAFYNAEIHAMDPDTGDFMSYFADSLDDGTVDFEIVETDWMDDE